MYCPALGLNVNIKSPQNLKIPFLCNCDKPSQSQSPVKDLLTNRDDVPTHFAELKVLYRPLGEEVTLMSIKMQ